MTTTQINTTELSGAALNYCASLALEINEPLECGSSAISEHFKRQVVKIKLGPVVHVPTELVEGDV